MTIRALEIGFEAKFCRMTSSGDWLIYELPFDYVYPPAHVYTRIALRLDGDRVLIAPVNKVDAPILHRELDWHLENAAHLVKIWTSDENHEVPESLSFHVKL